MASDEEVVSAAVEAAEAVILARYSRQAIADLDVEVRFEDSRLDVDIYLDAPAEDDVEAVARDAALAAQAAVDDLLES